MLSSELIKQIRHIELRAGHLASDALSGEYISAFKGQGMEFDEVREYTPGDDVRAIDWNVTARMNAPFIKRFREEREMTILLVVDVSPSQGFGSTGRAKQELAAEFAAVIAYLAVRNNDKVGLLLFSDHVERFIPPKKGRAHIWQIIKEVLSHEGRGRSTALDAALTNILLVQKRKALCFVVSDFQAQGYFDLAKAAAKRHDLVFVHIEDPRETNLPNVGLVHLKDNETGAIHLVDCSNRRVQNEFKALRDLRLRSHQEFCRKHAIGQLGLATDGDLVSALVRFLKNRERRRRL